MEPGYVFLNPNKRSKGPKSKFQIIDYEKKINWSLVLVACFCRQSIFTDHLYVYKTRGK